MSSRTMVSLMRQSRRCVLNPFILHGPVLSLCRSGNLTMPLQRRSGFAAARWYKEVTVKPHDIGGWGIWLDGRGLRTPARNLLRLPNYPLAMAVAAEWQWQKEGKVRTSTMPLNALAATAIDQPKPREVVIDTVMGYLDSDGMLCREELGPLSRAQSQAYEPIIEWAQKEFRTPFVASHSIFGSPQSTDTTAAVRCWLESLSGISLSKAVGNWTRAGLDQWELTVAADLASGCRSLLLGAAVMQGHVGVEEAIQLARLEEEVQIAEWGLVEGGHDIDLADARVRISAPSVFIRLLRLSSNR